MVRLPCEDIAVIVDRSDQLAELSSQLRGVQAIALDVESNGLHAYTPALCTVQLGLSNDGRDVDTVVILDTIALLSGKTPDQIAHMLAPLRKALGPNGPPKILHDLGFDARMLAKHGIALGNVRDTSVAARFLGMTSTSLANVASAVLSISLEKSLQQHDWSIRPIDDDQRKYLAADVLHLVRLENLLHERCVNADMLEDVQTEVNHRLARALVAQEDLRVPWTRIKGAELLAQKTQVVLRALAEHREELAKGQNVPPFRIVSNEVLIRLAEQRPTDVLGVGNILGRALRDHADVASLIGDALRIEDVPAAERAMLPRMVPMPREVVRSRKKLEQLLMGFRKAEGLRRGVDEQVVLPGHCLHDLAAYWAPDLGAMGPMAERPAPPTLTMEDFQHIEGLGTHRIARYGELLLKIAQEASGMTVV